MARWFQRFIIGVNNVLFTMVAFWVIDRYGRKPLYITGSLGMMLALVRTCSRRPLAGHFHGALVLVLVLLYLAFFSSCVGPVFWTLVPEIFPSDVRGTAMTVPVLLQWVANAVVVLFFPYAFHVIGKAVTLGFLAANVADPGDLHVAIRSRNKEQAARRDRAILACAEIGPTTSAAGLRSARIGPQRSCHRSRINDVDPVYERGTVTSRAGPSAARKTRIIGGVEQHKQYLRS